MKCQITITGCYGSRQAIFREMRGYTCSEERHYSVVCYYDTMKDARAALRGAWDGLKEFAGTWDRCNARAGYLRYDAGEAMIRIED